MNTFKKLLEILNVYIFLKFIFVYLKMSFRIHHDVQN